MTSRDRLLRLVGKTVNLAAIFVVFTLYFWLYEDTVMVVSCVAVGCTSRCVDSSLSFHHIPNEKRQLWLNTIKPKHWAPTNNDRVCGRHFILGLNRCNY